MYTTLTAFSTMRRPAALAIAVTVCALAVPASAGAFYGSASEQGSGSTNEASSNDSGLVIPDHTALNESLAPAGGSSNPGSFETPSPTPAIDTAAVDGFDWGDAALGAGMTMALIAIAGAAGLTLRRHGAVSPSAG